MNISNSPDDNDNILDARLYLPFDFKIYKADRRPCDLVSASDDLSQGRNSTRQRRKPRRDASGVRQDKSHAAMRAAWAARRIGAGSKRLHSPYTDNCPPAGGRFKETLNRSVSYCKEPFFCPWCWARMIAVPFHAKLLQAKLAGCRRRGVGQGRPLRRPPTSCTATRLLSYQRRQRLQRWLRCRRASTTSGTGSRLPAPTARPWWEA